MADHTIQIRILDRYIFREVLYSFLFAMCAFSAVFIGSGTLFNIARYITEYGASFSSIVKIFVFGLPGIVMWTFPMSTLLACLLTFGRLSASSEITAMKSCGIGFFRIASPALLIGFIISLVSIGFNEYVVPWSNIAYRNVVNYEIQKNGGLKSQEHIILKDIEEGKIKRLLYAKKYNADTMELEGITVQEFDEGKLSRVENAAIANWANESWIMRDGIIYDMNEGDAEHSMRFQEQKLPIRQTPSQIMKEQKSISELTMKEISSKIEILKAQSADTKALEAELYQRVSIPMASLVFSLIAIPLGLQPQRNSSSFGFALSIIIIFLYYALMTMGNAFAKSGVLPAMLAVWLPNLLGFVAGGFLIRRASS